MIKRILGSAALLLASFALAACTTSPPLTATSEPPVSASPSPSPTVETEQPRGTRENPIPFGESVTFDDLGEAGGPAWTVTIDQPRDMGPEILATAVEMYGDDESYLSTFRPDAGKLFLGYTGTVERLLDYPAAPGYDLDLALVGSDGNTYNMIVAGIGGPEEDIVNISEMYAPASARFSNVQVVAEGVTAGQVLVTLRNTGERIYFGTPPA